MNKLLLVICLLISASATASNLNGKFIAKEVGQLTIVTNEKEHRSGYKFLSIFNSYGLVYSDNCLGVSCKFYLATTHSPKIDGFDGMLWPEGKGSSGDGRWIESKGIVSLYTKGTPTFSIPGQPNEFIGIIQNSAGATGYGSHSFYVIDTKTGAVGKKGLNWGENKWDSDVEFIQLNPSKENDSCFLCIW
jgi:hypothetical protein